MLVELEIDEELEEEIDEELVLLFEMLELDVLLDEVDRTVSAGGNRLH